MKKHRKKKILALCVSFLVLGMGNILAERSQENAELYAETVEYNTETKTMQAQGAVVLKRGDSQITGDRANYISSTGEALVTGNVVITDKDMKLTCNEIYSDKEGHITAKGSVRGNMTNRSFASDKVDYYPKNDRYILMESGGTLVDTDGTFTANRIEGYLDRGSYIGTGNAHIVSAAKNIEAGGDRLKYSKADRGVAVLEGNAWAVQDGNTLRANTLTIYLGEDGMGKAK